MTRREPEATSLERRSLLGLLGAAALTGPVAMASATTGESTRLHVLVRHAEKAADDPRDPTLSNAGQLRAAALSELLGALPIDRICVTPLKRTRLTAEATATRLGLEVQAIEFGDTLQSHIEATAQALRVGGDGVALVVGHSNTLPLLIEALGGPADVQITDDQYDDLFLLIQTADSGKPWFLRASQR